jgi:hypothetical protein
MFIGEPEIKLRTSKGAVTEAGRLWLEMGGKNPARFQGPIQSTPNTRFVKEGITRHLLQRLVPGADGPEWRLTTKGKLNFREQNQWEVMIPAVLHRQNPKTGIWTTSPDMVVITDAEVTQNSVRGKKFLDTQPRLR